MRNTEKRKHGGSLTTQTLLDFDLGESSSDSDFRIEDHDDESDDFSMGSRDDNDVDDDEGDDDDDDADAENEDEDDDEQDVYGVGAKQRNKHPINGTAAGKKKKRNDTNDAAGDSGDPEDNEEDEDEESATDGGSSESKPKAESSDYGAVQPVQAPSSAKNTVISEKDAVVQKLLLKSICCACLGDRSDDQNEIVECDGCGVTVHEGCYGVSECTSISSTTSSCSTEPWFCDACKAGVQNPDCELCPNRGGIFKETDVGKWVHLVCALYVPGVAFGEVDQLSSVTLFEMPYNKWGAKTCSLCEDAKLARTGVCIGCDAGMCKTYFHVTCAQYHGLLSEAHSEEADQADPFYAHCKIHSDKTLIKHRKRNYNAIKMKALNRQLEEEEASRQRQPQSSEQARIERKLTKHRKRYLLNKETKNPPWVPTQKMPRLLITSATACKKLLFKAELMGLDMAAIEFQQAQMAALTDVRKKWHISPAFSVEFIGYYLDRAIRLDDLKKNLQEQMTVNKRLLVQQQQLRTKYDRSVVRNQEALKRNEACRESIATLYAHICALAPNKALPPIDQIGKPPQPTPLPLPSNVAVPYGKGSSLPSVLINAAAASSSAALCPTPPTRTMTVPTAAALKMGVGFPLQNLLVPGGGKRDDTGRILSTQCKQNSEDLLNECGICKRCQDQHLLAKCDTCHLHYHLGCLNPPLTRHPKKSKLYGWQCSECDQSDDSNPESIIIPKTPRKSRTRYSKDGTIVPYDLSFAAEHYQEGGTGREYNHASRKQGRTSTTVSTSREASTTGPPEHYGAANLQTFATSQPPARTVSPTVKQEEATSSPPSQTENGNSLPSTAEASVSSESSLLMSPTKTPGKRGRKRKMTQDLASLELHSPAVLIVDPAYHTQQPQDIRQQDQDEKHTNQKVETTEDDNQAGPEQEQGQHREQHHHGLAHAQTKMETVDHAEQEMRQQQPQPGEGKVECMVATSQTTPPQHEQSSLVDTSGGGCLEDVTPKCMKVYSTPIVATVCETTAAAATSTHHKHSKRRKEKHRNRSPNAERLISKDHKRKRKRRNHDYDMDCLADGADCMMVHSYGDSRPRIKIKIKSVPDGSNTHTTQIFYVRDETGPEKTSTPHLVSEAADSSSQMVGSSGDVALMMDMANLSPCASHSSQFDVVSPRSVPSHGRGRTKQQAGGSRAGAATVGSSGTEESLCDVCQGPGASNNTVQCDECHKNYHFGCLDPPLKKTPKRRGYSWHCADCDPTDVEN